MSFWASVHHCCNSHCCHYTVWFPQQIGFKDFLLASIRQTKSSNEQILQWSLITSWFIVTLKTFKKRKTSHSGPKGHKANRIILIFQHSSWFFPEPEKSEITCWAKIHHFVKWTVHFESVKWNKTQPGVLSFRCCCQRFGVQRGSAVVQEGACSV